VGLVFPDLGEQFLIESAGRGTVNHEPVRILRFAPDQGTYVQMPRMVLVSIEDAVRMRDAARRERGTPQPELYCRECEQPVLPTREAKSGGQSSRGARS
jgi:hypothetical protein